MAEHEVEPARGDHLTREGLIKILAERLGLTRREAREAVFTMQDAMTRALADGKRVTWFEFGSMAATIQEPRTIRNPSTGGQMESGRSARVSFRPSPALKDFVSGATPLPEGQLTTSVSRKRSPST